MAPPLFDFRLRTVDEITPWGEADAPSLHWFALSDGCYRLNVGDHTLLEYSDEVRREFGAHRYCDYQVVRLHEDVLEMLPYVLEPVPATLQPFIRAAHAYSDAWQALDDTPALAALTAPDETAPWDSTLDDAVVWIGDRTLDSLYLSPSACIWMWSDEQQVHIQWDNRGKLWHGRPAWSAQQGSFSLPRTDFVREIEDFHTSFMQQMAHRVSTLLATGGPTGVHLDLAQLRDSQRRRDQQLALSQGGLLQPTRWDVVTDAIQRLEVRRLAPSR